MRPADLAKKAGVPASSIKNLVYGKVKQPREDLIRKITKVLNVNPEFLLYGVSENRSVFDDQDQFIVWNAELYLDVVAVVDQVLQKSNITDLDAREIRNIIEQLYIFALKKEKESGSYKTDPDTAECMIKLYLKN